MGKSTLILVAFLMHIAIWNPCLGKPSHGAPGHGTPSQPVDHPKAAREIVHKSNWASFGSLSTEEVIKGYPMVSLISIADSGKEESSTGHIYFYLMDLDFSGKDWRLDNRVTMMVSQEQDLSCTKMDIDPMDPRCRRVLLSGKVVELKEETEQYETAVKAFQNRHPDSVRWAQMGGAHKFYMCTLEIQNIYLFDGFGGPKQLTAEQYYNVPAFP